MVNMKQDKFGARATVETAAGPAVIYRLDALEKTGLGNISRLPFSIRVLLENVLRGQDGFSVVEEDVVKLAAWQAQEAERTEMPYKPARVVLQDFTGVPSVVDLAALRSAMHRLGGDPSRINPQVPSDMVIDHSVQVDFFGTEYAFLFNAKKEFERNAQRYAFLRWGQEAFENFRVVPPDTGIIHQINLEYLGQVVQTRSLDGERVAFPDTLVGTDSHTTMINGLGILGWGVGGIEAEAAMLGQPIYMLTPDVIGVKLYGELPQGATATDLVLTLTQMLRKFDVVGKFVEYFGPGVSKLGLADRATIANMSPDYGATMGFFAVDAETLHYLANTGRSPEQVDLVERYTKEQGLFRTDATPDPAYTAVLELDMSTVETSLAGPKRPQDRIVLGDMKKAFHESLVAPTNQRGFALPKNQLNQKVAIAMDGETYEMNHGSVVIAAITSCTNTSNPSVIIGAALLAKKAVERGLMVKPYVKTSLAPGSRVVRNYLETAGLLPYLEALHFHIVAYGCTTCIGNSGPLPEPVVDAIQEHNLVAAAVLSGNRNFEGRVNAYTQANYLASPPLVVAYALAGTVDIDLTKEPLALDPNGKPVYLQEIWPTLDEVKEVINGALKPEMFKEQYSNVFEGSELWRNLEIPEGQLYTWDSTSTYIQEPPFFTEMTTALPSLPELKAARVLGLFGDSITTDHISPAGPIALDSPAARYLMEHDVKPADFNTYGARRGNHEVMMRGTFANIRLKNLLVPGTEGGVTRYLPTDERMSMYDAAMRYLDNNIPLIVLAGKEYGTGSSRDWAAKGTYLLGVQAVIAESFERIHRSNLVGMGVLPLQFQDGESWQSLGLTGEELYDIDGLDEDMAPGQKLTVLARSANGDKKVFTVISRLDTPVEVRYWRNGGILHTVLRDMVRNG